MAPSIDQIAAPLARTILPSGWLFALTGSLLLGQLVAASPIVLSSELLFLLLIPLVLIINPLATLRSLARLIAGGFDFRADCHTPKASYRAWALLAMVAGLMFALGYYRHRQLLFPSFPPNHLRSVMNGNSDLYLEGLLLHEPERLPNRSRWYLRAERMWHPTGAEEISGDMLLNLRHLRREWHYGDRIRAPIRPTVPKDSGNPGGFNYATYLSRRGIYAIGFLETDEKIELVERAPNRFRGAIESLRREIRRYIQSYFTPESGALMKALVVGDMGEISKKMRVDFTAAGVNHVLSISGLHVAMLGLVVFGLVRWAGSFSVYLLLRCNLIKIATLCSFVAVIFYTALAGAMVPTVRSAIMIGVYEVAVLLDREEEVLTSLTFAALLIALVWPGVIADISFQLSFLAVFSIAWGMRQVLRAVAAPEKDQLPQERSRIWPKLRSLGMHLLVPLLATVGTGPLIAHYFGHLSLAGFVSNPVIVPLVGFVVVPLGLAISFISLAWPQLLTPLVSVTEWLLWLTGRLVEWFAALPFAHLAVPAPNLWEVGALYLFIASLLWLRKNRHAVIAVVLSSSILMADVAYWWGERWARTEIRVTHLNVGQGDAVVVEFPGAKTLLIDAGGTASGEFDTGEAIVGPFLRSRKILKVEYLLVSHPRIDHYGGMASIVREFTPEEYWSGSVKGRTRRFEELDEILDRSQVKRIMLTNEEPCRSIAGVSLCFLYPPADRSDDVSVVLQLEYGKARFLFAGDIDKRDEQLLAQNPARINSAVVKVPRHGNATGSTREFISAVQPRLAIVSGTTRNAAAQKEEVAERYRAAGAEILRTEEDGAIVITTDGHNLRYESVKSGKRGTIKF
jgi:competence protein ComEC